MLVMYIQEAGQGVGGSMTTFRKARFEQLQHPKKFSHVKLYFGNSQLIIYLKMVPRKFDSEETGFAVV